MAIRCNKYHMKEWGGGRDRQGGDMTRKVKKRQYRCTTFPSMINFFEVNWHSVTRYDIKFGINVQYYHEWIWKTALPIKWWHQVATEGMPLREDCQLPPSPPICFRALKYITPDGLQIHQQFTWFCCEGIFFIRSPVFSAHLNQSSLVSAPSAWLKFPRDKRQFTLAPSQRKLNQENYWGGWKQCQIWYKLSTSSPK